MRKWKVVYCFSISLFACLSVFIVTGCIDHDNEDLADNAVVSMSLEPKQDRPESFEDTNISLRRYTWTTIIGLHETNGLGATIEGATFSFYSGLGDHIRTDVFDVNQIHRMFGTRHIKPQSSVYTPWHWTTGESRLFHVEMRFWGRDNRMNSFDVINTFTALPEP